MKELIVTLKQHTPMIHFQHYQENATLRASEVKPKLDRYIMEKLGENYNENKYEKGCEIAKKNGWIIGENALNYKMKITPKGENLIKLDITTKEKEKNGKINLFYHTEYFPLLLSNMGGKEDKKSLTNFSMYKSLTIKIQTTSETLYKMLYEIIPEFIMNNNFGQRSNKGFGSFSIEDITDNNKNKTEINCFNIIGKNAYYFYIKNIKDINSIKEQKRVFNKISSIWKEIKNKCKPDHENKINSLKTYISRMKEFNTDSQRMPAPIIFKPLLDEKTKTMKIYVLFNLPLIFQLKSDYPKGNEVIRNNRSSSAIINTHNIDNTDKIIQIQNIIKEYYRNNNTSFCIHNNKKEI